ncbi:hypothetical protein GQF56_20935 [Rhodobacter sphaeroides]|jgi:rhodanese-related sulfurtransferase|uniref:Rhodanese domain-containing protein n=1 Tax=Cereibacter sphaeroides (strain ATCC 17023 / DSM 158 / JCM 6121 / CCUG 31486 / LMG 2827 / NBRC 12203 / NCIMB 8253 / ATH 2.4.1.) TaxID=272943 RepID=Q3IUY0_CERS4|nr:hypothetical protein [Cereibacter sphaeroides]ABA81654.1 hypothetical protein RSP_4204 [Cereibacter sphaeroides 2.4.1]AMJ49799.1 hypothetical protein APX01_19760 [Cereibacter sphaeroides]ANS36558.1 hypothetical protein A3858_20040 [Cereibacter sphaeroides]ATN65570.1 hypothetical protein A3857_19785 [Cereibacter sphaeroides]AXC64179.1 hypothetical protein DQL45_22735 [Cereibacter sphaeroides 2.4.1]
MTARELPEARQLCPTSTRKALASGALLVDVREADEQAAVGFAEAEVLSIPLSQFEARCAEVLREREVVVAWRFRVDHDDLRNVRLPKACDHRVGQLADPKYWLPL